MRRSKYAAGAVAIFAGLFLGLAAPAGALTAEECAALVAEGEQAREDLRKLIEAAADDPSLGGSDDPETASYIAALVASSAINAFGFVSAAAGEPLELCLPEGSDTLTMFPEGVVLWRGLATHDAYPVTVVIPADTTCGTHTMTATGDGVDESVEFTVGGACVEVAGISDTRGFAFLPRTGTEIGQAVGVALALIAVGYSMHRGRRIRTEDLSG